MVREAKPPKPRGVFLVLEDGSEVEVLPSYFGKRRGMREWRVVVPDSLSSPVRTVRVAVMPGRTTLHLYVRRDRIV